MLLTLFFAATALTTIVATPAVRRHLITKPLLPFAKAALPTIGETERIALEAGDVWFDGDLFSGKPDWHKLLAFKIQPLNKAEQAFLDGPVEEFLSLFTDWEVMQQRDLPAKAWAFLKTRKFFGIIIPKAYGGLGFSAAAHAAIVTKIATRSITAAVTVMVPNSLGPGELLMRYGTPAQRNHYLPRLADGRELPCFGLTEPTAGSDAASGLSEGIVVKRKIRGKTFVGLSLTFNKRYITLAPVATVIGLAFTLKDPHKLLPAGLKNGGEGITLALLARTTPGLVIGPRHDPLGVPFQNGPVSGENVFVPLDAIIGGPAYAGQGWRMLMEALSAGRGISLPSLSVGAAQLAARATSAHAVVREQFGLPIGRFEGVRERLARIAGLAYGMHAARHLTTGALDAGHHPSVLAAIAKGYLTEGMRTTLNDAMDLFGGAAIMRGPNNIFAHPYTAVPTGITVEGANILTRSLIIFGQGALRCHPYLQKEVDSLQQRDLKGFDAALFGHLAHAAKNAMRAVLHGYTGAIFAHAPVGHPHAARFRQLSRYSAVFAVLTELALLSLGGALKRKEYLTGRYADALAWLYLNSAALKRDADERHPAALQPVLNWVLTHGEHEIETALRGIINNLPGAPLRWLAGILAGPLTATPPSDHLTDAAALALQTPAVRAALSPHVFIPAATEPGLGTLEDAYRQTLSTSTTRAQVTAWVKTGKLKAPAKGDIVLTKAMAALVKPADGKKLGRAEVRRKAAIQVNAFAAPAYRKQR